MVSRNQRVKSRVKILYVEYLHNSTIDIASPMTKMQYWAPIADINVDSYHMAMPRKHINEPRILFRGNFDLIMFNIQWPSDRYLGVLIRRE